MSNKINSYNFIKVPSGEVETREYVVFYSPNKDEYKFYNVFSGEPKITILGQVAILLTESAAEDMANVLSQNSPKSWFYYKVDYFLRKEKELSKEKPLTLPKEGLVEMLDNLPENRPLYKDSGLWQIRTDDMEDVLYEQDVNESFFDFIQRAYSNQNNFMQ